MNKRWWVLGAGVSAQLLWVGLPRIHAQELAPPAADASVPESVGATDAAVTTVPAAPNAQLHAAAAPTATRLPRVTVVAPVVADGSTYQAQRAQTATKTDAELANTPAAVQVVPAQVLRDQQVTRIDKALENVSGVYTQKSGLGDVSFFSLRGFSSYDGSSAFVYRDGIRADYSSGTASFPDLANIERLEVLKGPASILYGRIEPGGLVNLVTKRPLETPYFSVQQQAGSFRYFRTTVDGTGPIIRGKLLARVNMAYENRRSFQEFVRGNRLFVAPVLQWNISKRTSVDAWLDYLNAHDGLPDTVPVLGSRPASIPRSRNFGEPKNGMLDTTQERFGLNLAHRFSDQWSLRTVLDGRLTSGFAHPLIYNTGIADQDNCTTTECLVNRALQANTGKSARTQSYYAATELTGHFETFRLRHTVLVGADYWRTACCGKGNGFVGIDDATLIQPVDLYNPQRTGIPQQALSDAAAAAELSTDNTSVQNWLGVYAQDQLELPFRIHVLGGLRYNHVRNRNPTDDQTDSNNGRVTPRVGLLWRALEELSIYGSYVQNYGASNGRTTQGLVRAQSADQWEVGLKSDVLKNRLHATLAAYNIDKRNSAIPDPDPARAALGYVVPVGEIRNRGLELDVTADLLPEWKLIASYSFIDSEILKDRVVDEMGIAQPDNTGNRLYGVPKHGGSLWTSYELRQTVVRGLKFAAGVIGRTVQQASNENDVQLKGYVLTNAALGYSRRFGPTKLTAQLNVDNIFDTTYYSANGFGGGLGPYAGTPRSFLASLRGEL